MGIEKAVFLNGRTAVHKRRITDNSNNFSIFLLILEALLKISKKTIPCVEVNSAHYFCISGGAQTGDSQTCGHRIEGYRTGSLRTESLHRLLYLLFRWNKICQRQVNHCDFMS